ncbi:MFS transporter [Streptomyces sp. NBC_00198]|uniref:MFS transporter n=1 Tax=Streptomyces sp. NBC_00198 TaxID=2975677 RepID=UPI0022526DF7|nr:MFS transporter [Streptomyces sp. NBC_00198]MCX5281566.1 MFS transporter [Streptomyces sp. NBC_00198]
MERDAMTDESVAQKTSPVRAYLEIGAVGLGALMASLTQTLVIPVLPVISKDIGASTTQTQWLLTSTLLVAAVSVPVVGRFADMVGRRLMLVFSLGALALGSLIDALTTDTTLMIVGRALTGLSAASIPLGISLLAAVLPVDRRSSATALISAMLGIGSALGLPLAGLLADNVDYHVLFWIGAVGAVLSLVAILALVGEPRHTITRSVDLPGIALLTSGLVCLVLPLSQGGTWGWGSLRTIGLLVAAVVLLALLVRVESRSAAPVVNVRALANPPIAMTNVASLFFGFALFASFVGTANYVQAPAATGYGFGSSVLTAGLCLLPSGLLMLLLAPVTAKLSTLWGAGRVLFLAGLIVAAGLITRILFVDSLWQIVVGTAIIGAGSGIGYATLPTLINTYTPATDLAAANGINALARSLGSTLASAVGGSILASMTMALGGFEIPSLKAYRVLFVICAVAAVAAALLGLIASRTKVPQEHTQPVVETV